MHTSVRIDAIYDTFNPALHRCLTEGIGGIVLSSLKQSNGSRKSRLSVWWLVCNAGSPRSSRARRAETTGKWSKWKNLRRGYSSRCYEARDVIEGHLLSVEGCDVLECSLRGHAYTCFRGDVRKLGRIEIESRSIKQMDLVVDCIFLHSWY